MNPARWPIRLRVTAAFALAMALVLAGAGVLIYLGVRAELTDALEDSLETRAAATARLIIERGEARPGLTRGLDDPGETFTQIFDADGRLLVSTPGLPLRPILDAGERERAIEGLTITLTGIALSGDEDPDEIEIEALEETASEPFEEARARVLARGVDLGGERLTIVVGSTFEDPNEALDRLVAVLLVCGPIALLVTCAAGYGAVSGALRPVERMRLQASRISAAEPGGRLPVTAADDELGRLGTTLNDMLARLEAALARERALVADASHELRTPLAILRAELEVALRGPRSVDRLEAAIGAAAGEARRLSGLADDMLLLARADAGEVAVRREPLDAVALTAAVRDRFAPRAAELGRALTADRAPAPLMIDADREQLERALATLVENALGHGAGAVGIGARRDDGWVELAVRDEGPGFPPEFLPHAFERFRQGKTSRSARGAGLGLAIAQVVASAHGGTARAENRQGRGAIVTLRLPAALHRTLI